MFVLFLSLKAWRYLSGNKGAERPTGSQIYKGLEDLSGLKLDMEPQIPKDDERANRETTAIGSFFSRWKTPKRNASENETEMEATRVDRGDPHEVNPQMGVVRQTTWESANGEVRQRLEREI